MNKAQSCLRVSSLQSVCRELVSGKSCSTRSADHDNQPETQSHQLIANKFSNLLKSFSILSNMEIAGLVVGTASLAVLYIACIEAVDRIDSYKKCGPETKHLSAQLYANKTVLRNWANRVGISREGRTSERLHRHNRRRQMLKVAILILCYLKGFWRGTKDQAAYEGGTN